MIDSINQKVTDSDYTIRRDKLYNQYIQTIHYVSSYVFRLHFKSTGYKSLAYIKNKNNFPKEQKYKSVWSNYHLKNNFTSQYPGEFLHADIKYIKIKDKLWHLHVILETYSNSVLVWELNENCSSEKIINLFKKSLKKLYIMPKIFHSNHGVEYANFSFKKFLEDNNIIQSMSIKATL